MRQAGAVQVQGLTPNNSKGWILENASPLTNPLNFIMGTYKHEWAKLEQSRSRPIGYTEAPCGHRVHRRLPKKSALPSTAQPFVDVSPRVV